MRKGTWFQSSGSSAAADTATSCNTPPQFRQALPGHGARANQGGFFQKGTCGQFSYFLLDQLDPIGGSQITLGQHHDAVPHVQHPQDVHMFAGLGLHGVVRCDDQHGQVHARGTGKHLTYEAFVTWNVDDAQAIIPEDQLGESQLNRNAPPLLLGKPVRISSGKRLHEGGLAVVDMTSRSEDQIEHAPEFSKEGHTDVLVPDLAAVAHPIPRKPN